MFCAFSFFFLFLSLFCTSFQSYSLNKALCFKLYDTFITWQPPQYNISNYFYVEVCVPITVLQSRQIGQSFVEIFFSSVY